MAMHAHTHPLHKVMTEVGDPNVQTVPKPSDLPAIAWLSCPGSPSLWGSEDEEKSIHSLDAGTWDQRPQGHP